jgi:Protein of unknown function (DUF2948)
MPDLKLIALDADDLSVLSAHLQDAVLRVGDMMYLPKERRFVAVANRFDWNKALSPTPSNARSKKAGSPLERRRTGLRFERVLAAKVSGIDLKNSRQTLALLAINFAPTALATKASKAEGAVNSEAEGGPLSSPDGDVTLTFSGGAAIRLTVECLEAEMKDLGAAWAAKRSPSHPDDSV